MLKPVKSKALLAGAARFAVVASQYNARYVNAMLAAARSELKRAGVKNLLVFRVPGAFEIPVIAARLARLGSAVHPLNYPPSTFGSGLSGIICLGVILRGQTSHAAHIGEAVSRALMQIQLKYEVPVIHEVLLLDDEGQARARCLDPKHNRGNEAAQTALAMAKVMKSLRLGAG